MGEYKADLAIYFHSNETSSVSLRENAIGPDSQRFGRLLLFTFFCARQIANLGPRKLDVSAPLSLHSVGEAFEPRYQFMAEQVNPGKRRFEASIEVGKENLRFSLKPHGFGLFNSQAAEFARDSVACLLQYLRNAFAHDELLQKQISVACSMLGGMGTSGHITVSNQHHQALEFAVRAIAVAESRMKNMESSMKD